MEPAFHEDTHDVEEHGRRWTVCNACGAQWDDDDQQITEGDGSCEENALRKERPSCGPRDVDHQDTSVEMGIGEVCNDCGHVVKG